MSISLHVGSRFLRRGTERGRFSAMTFFAWLAIGVGVGAMASLLSVMYGFEKSLKDKFLNAYPHVFVRPPSETGSVPLPTEWEAKIKASPGVVRDAVYLESEMIVQSPWRALGTVVWGQREADLKHYESGLVKGELPTLASKKLQVLMGSELARRLSVGVGDTVKLISPIAKGGAFGMVPQSDTYEISGLYSSGHYEFDQQYVFLLIEDAQDLLRLPNAITGWQVWGKDDASASLIKDSLTSVLPVGWETQSWMEFNSALFQSLKLEQFAMFLILSLAVLIAVMNVAITLVMHVSHKRKNIGILKALGASANQIRNAFLWQGALLGGAGILLGATIFTAFVVYIRRYSDYLLPDFYYDRTIPVEIRPGSLIAILLVASLLILVAIWFPAKRAASLDPIESIRE